MLRGLQVFAWFVTFGAATSVLAGDLTGTLKRPSPAETAPSEPSSPKSPPANWEIPLPLSPAQASKPPKKPSSASALLVLIPKTPGKRPKAPLINLNNGQAKPPIGFISLQDTVTFAAKKKVTLVFSGEEKPLAVTKKVTKGFKKEGVYRFTSQEDPKLRGLIVVGAGAKTQEVSDDFKVKNLDAGSWMVFLVTQEEIIAHGEVVIPKEGEATLSLEVP